MLDTRQTNRRFEEEWYTCTRCGCDFPRSKMMVQNGLTLCNGLETNNCRDEPGYDAAFRRVNPGYERKPEALPQISEDL